MEGFRAGSGDTQRLSRGRRSRFCWPEARRSIPHFLQHLLRFPLNGFENLTAENVVQKMKMKKMIVCGNGDWKAERMERVRVSEGERVQFRHGECGYLTVEI